MTLIDNTNSAMNMIGQEGDELWTKMTNITFYGETENKDCDGQYVCNLDLMSWEKDPGCFSKTAFMLSNYAGHMKPGLLRIPSSWPQYKLKADGAWGGETVYDNLTFINFTSVKTYCGTQQKIFRVNPFAGDFTPTTYIRNARFLNVSYDAYGYIFTPPNSWASIDDCGEFPCTGPNNVLVRFENASYEGTILPPNTTIKDFEIIPANDENSGGFPTCKKVSAWNGYLCQNPDLA